MTWMEAWERMDPAKVLERRQEQERMRVERGREWRQEQAKTALGELFEGKYMTQDQSGQIEDLLVDWYYWAKASREFLGYSNVSPMFRGIKPDSGDVHSTGEDVDQRINAYNCEIIDVCIGELPVMLRAAIGVHARNRAAGTAVHRHPRIVSIEQQHALYLQAKEHLCPLLIRKGLVSR